MTLASQYSVVMFAHNEEQNIKQSVLSVLENSDERLHALKVIANGCSDQTVPILNELAQHNKKIQVIDLSIGDKCNAWNQYVHEFSEDEGVHFFTDADVRFTKNAFPRLNDTLRENAYANGVAGLPFSGRNIEQYKDLVQNNYCLFGNCYGLKGEFLQRLQSTGFRLPIGLGWIDSAITKVVNSNVGEVPHPKPGKVIFNEECGYEFDSLSLLKWSDWRLYINRITRYRLGKLQEKYLEKIDFVNWPENLLEINQKVLADIESKQSIFHFQDRYLVKKRILGFAKKMQHRP